MEHTLRELMGKSMLRRKHSDSEKLWHAGGMGQQDSHEVQQSQMQSSAPGVADWQGCASAEKHLGPWLITIQT